MIIVPCSWDIKTENYCVMNYENGLLTRGQTQHSNKP